MPNPKISIEELERKFSDPDVPESDLVPYLDFDRDASGAFAPSVVPNPDLVERAEEQRGVMDWANSLARTRRHLRFNRRLNTGVALPVLVSEGDSWFQFPVFLEDVIDCLGDDYLIWSVDAAGDTLQNMVIDNPEYLDALDTQRDRVRAFLFSGAGNDIVGEDSDGVPVIEKIVRDFSPGQPPEFYVDTPAFDAQIAFIDGAYREVFNAVAADFPTLPIVIHGYDYSLPGGQPGDNRHPKWADQDEWLGAPLRKKGIVDFDLQCAIVRVMVDRLNSLQKSLAGGNNPAGAFANVHHVDVRGLLQTDEWADELHPTNRGYRKVARLFAETLRQALPIA